MKKPPRAPHTAFSTELRGGSRALKARLGNLFSAGKARAPLLVAAALLVTVLAGGLVACTQTPAPAPTPSPTPTDGHLPVDTVGQARIAMELQYYDTLQNIYEVPILADAESDAAQSINAEIQALVTAWRADIATAYEHVNSQVFAFPSTAGRYLNIILLEVPGGTGSDGFIHTWVYDAEKAVRVTGEEALSLAGVSLAELEPQAADLFLTENPGTTLQLTALELAGFRIRGDGRPELYLYGQTDDPTGNMDPWQCVYLWADGALTRCANLAYPQASYSPFRLLVPLEEVDKTELPLWAASLSRPCPRGPPPLNSSSGRPSCPSTAVWWRAKPLFWTTRVPSRPRAGTSGFSTSTAETPPRASVPTPAWAATSRIRIPVRSFSSRVPTGSSPPSPAHMPSPRPSTSQQSGTPVSGAMYSAMSGGRRRRRVLSTAM